MAKEITNTMIEFGANIFGRRRFIAKIKSDNVKSQGLFLKMGFKQFAALEQFGEIHYEYNFEEYSVD